MALLQLYADTSNNDLIPAEEIDLMSNPGRYYPLYCYEGDPRKYFTEVWATDNGECVSVEYDETEIFSVNRIWKQRNKIAKQNHCKLLYLLRVRMPEDFFKKWYW